jgi:hypothetical protein
VLTLSGYAGSMASPDGSQSPSNEPEGDWVSVSGAFGALALDCSGFLRPGGDDALGGSKYEFDVVKLKGDGRSGSDQGS